VDQSHKLFLPSKGPKTDWNNIVVTGLVYELDGTEFEFRVGDFLQARPDRLWGPPSLSSEVYRGSCPGAKRSDCDDHLNSEIQAKWELRLNIPPPPAVSSWKVLDNIGQLYLTGTTGQPPCYATACLPTLLWAVSVLCEHTELDEWT